MLKIKNGVTGFIYDSMHGYVSEIFTEPIDEKMRLSEDELLFTNIDEVNDMFEITSKEILEENGDDGLNEVLEWI